MTEQVVESPVGTLWFVHWLRSIAVAIVVFVHLFALFWTRGPESKMYAHVAPPPPSVRPPWDFVVPHMQVHLFYGTIAVGFFFLVSGFLIPLTMEGRSVGRFVTIRLFRIYPVWIFSIALIAAIFVGQWAHGSAMGYISPGTWLTNVTATNDMTGSPALNPVGWTLTVEVKFYLLCALAGATFGLRRAWPIVVLVIGWTLFGIAVWGHFPALAVDHHRPYAFAQAIAWDAKHMPVVLIGVCFYNRFRSNWSATRFLITAGICFICMTAAAFGIHDDPVFGTAKFAGYTAAIMVFAVAYAARERFRPRSWIATAADLAYPVYALHFVLGIVLMNLFVRWSGSPTLATLATLTVVVVLAAVLHRWIEAPLIRFGKRVRWPSVRQTSRQPDQSLGERG